MRLAVVAPCDRPFGPGSYGYGILPFVAGEVDVFAPCGSAAPARCDLHYLPCSYGSPPGDCEALAAAWYGDTLRRADVVADLTAAGRVAEDLYLSDPEGARYVLHTPPGAPGPRFGRRNLLPQTTPEEDLPAAWRRVAAGGRLDDATEPLPAALVVRRLFQRWCCQQVEGRILNFGCNIDPAGLKGSWPDRVWNVDLLDVEEGALKARGERVPIAVDEVADMTAAPWPWDDDAFGLVVLGDVLEDLPPGTQAAVLAEAARVAGAVCITCPEDTPERDPHHRTTITRPMLSDLLFEAGFAVVRYQRVDYGFERPGGGVVEGHMALARRRARGD